MATIEMDISEYNEIMENKKLLQEALEEQEKLNVEIKKLQKEKIEALEAAKMKVVKVTKKKSSQVVVSRLDLFSGIMPDYKMRFDSDYFDKLDQDSQEKGRVARIFSLVVSGKGSVADFNYLVRLLFRTHTVQDPDEVYTETVGLDEVKDKIREEVSKKVKEELEQYEKLKRDYKTLKEKEEYFLKEIEVLEKLNSTLSDDNVEYKTLVEEYIQNSTSLIEAILAGPKSMIGFSKKDKFIKKISDLAYKADLKYFLDLRDRIKKEV